VRYLSCGLLAILALPGCKTLSDADVVNAAYFAGKYSIRYGMERLFRDGNDERDARLRAQARLIAQEISNRAIPVLYGFSISARAIEAVRDYLQRGLAAEGVDSDLRAVLVRAMESAVSHIEIPASIEGILTERARKAVISMLQGIVEGLTEASR
jgi:hypothetical protein